MTLSTYEALIGRTPLVELRTFSPRPGVRIFAKLEGLNPTGSIKDRIAVSLLDKAVAEGRLGPSAAHTVVEASSGNTGIALAALCKQRGHQAHIVVPGEVPPAILDILERMDVAVTRCHSRSGLTEAIEQARELGRQPGHTLLGQFDDAQNVLTHYETTGLEIAEALDRIDLFVAGIGTGGTLMGVARRLRETHPEARIIGVEPKMGERLQGLRSLDEAAPPPLLDLDQLHGRYLIDNTIAIQTTEAVMRTEGIFAGISAGACLNAALRAVARLDGPRNLVVMFSDGAWKYLPAKPWDAAHRHDPEIDNVHWW